MGELHIEIIHDRIRREYGIETDLGPLQVAYRETILREVSATGSFFMSLDSFLEQVKEQVFKGTCFLHIISFDLLKIAHVQL